MGEYFAQNGLGWVDSRWAIPPMTAAQRASQTAAPRAHRRTRLKGVGEYFASNGLGEFFSGTGGALVDWAKQEEKEHAGIFGLGEFFVPQSGAQAGVGEYFASNGLGDDAAVAADIKNQRFMQWGLLAAVGVGGASYLLKSKHPIAWAGAGVAGVAAAVYLYNVTG